MMRFKSMPNFRRLADGAAAAAAGGDPAVVVRLNVYRSSRPDFLTADEIEEFRSAGIRSIIDFRSTTEYRKASGLKLLDRFYPTQKVKLPLKFRYNPGDVVVYVPLDKSTAYQTDVLGKQGFRYFVRVFARHVLNQEGLFGQYCDMINHSQASICAALKVLTDPANVPAMLNCAHGKDRTGIVSALVLGCLGRSKEDIVADYAKSETELAAMQSRLEAEIIDQFHMCRTFATAKAETMAKVIDYIEDNYGSICNYLESIGFTVQEQELLRKNLMPSS